MVRSDHIVQESHHPETPGCLPEPFGILLPVDVGVKQQPPSMATMSDMHATVLDTGAGQTHWGPPLDKSDTANNQATVTCHAEEPTSIRKYLKSNG